MEPLSYEQLVEGNLYIRRFRDNGQILPAAVYKGICLAQTDFNETIYIKFDAGFNACFIEPASNYDIFDIEAFIPPFEPIAHYILNISNSEHIGDLVEGINIKLIDEKDPISYELFKNGDACLKIIHPQGNVTTEIKNTTYRCFVYNQESIQTWFNTGSSEEPQTRIPLRQDMLKRFTYVIN